MLLRTPWTMRRRLSMPPAPKTREEILARRAAARQGKTPRLHADGSHCHHCPEDT